MIKIKVLRFDPEKDSHSHLETYEIESKEKMKVLDALNFINDHYGTNLAFRSSCRAGQCGSCALKIDGNIVLACKAEIHADAVIEPLDFTVIKDLVVDRKEIEEKANQMRLFLEKCGLEDSLKKDSLKTCPELIPAENCVESKKVRSCIECYSCLSACPVIKESSEYAGPYFMRYLSKFALDPRDSGNRALEGFDEGLYCCTTCGKCAEVCPKEISIPGDAIEKLRAIACKEDVGPLDPHKKLKKTIMETGRSVDPLEKSFIKTVQDSIEGSDGTSTITHPKPKVAFFTGCLVDYRMPDIGFSLLKVLKENGIEVDVPTDQVCCGSPMIRTGQLDALDELVKQNKKALGEYDTVITVCAGCGATLKKDYPKFGADLNVLDISEFLIDKLDMENTKPVNMKVTYHDPCHLARSQGIKLEPREILKKIKGLEFVEMEEPDRCCGSGGGVKSGKPEISAALGETKAEMIKKLDVDAVVTICPFCQIHIRDSLEKAGIDNVKVLNILELLDMAYS